MKKLWLLALVLILPLHAHAAWKWIGGAELNSTTDGVEVTTNSAPIATTTTAHTGSYGWEVKNGAGFQRQIIYTTNQTTVGIIRAWVYVIAYPNASTQLIRFSNTANASQGNITMTTTGTLVLLEANGVQIGSASSVVPLNTWTYIELKNDASGAGTLEGRLNGSVFATGANSAAGTWARALWGNVTGAQTTNDIIFDDIAITDGATGYPGNSSEVFMRPNGAGDIAGWTKAGSAATNWQSVINQTTADGTTLVKANQAYSVKDNNTFTFTTSGSSVHMNTVFTGDALVLGCAINNSSTGRISTVTDSNSNTYTKAGTYGGTNIEVELWYALNATVNNGTTVTVNAQTGDQGACVWYDVQGLSASGAFDLKAGSSGTGTSLDSTATAQTKYTSEILFGVNGQANNRAWTAGSGYTQISSTGNGSAAGVQTEYKTVSSPGTYNATASLDTSSNWASGVFGFVAPSDLYNFTDSGLHSYDTINALVVGSRYTNDTADAATAYKLQYETSANSTNKGLSAALLPNTTIWRSFGVNATPVDTYQFATTTGATGAALTNTDLDNGQAGYILTTGGTNFVQIDGLWEYADYTPGVAPPLTGVTLFNLVWGTWF